MSAATLTIDSEERDALHGLMLRRLFVLGEEPLELARAEGVGIERLGEEFGEDLRLMQDLGWLSESDSGTVELTLLAEELARTLKRLRRDARRAPCEERREREPQESDEERRRRFRRGVEVCEALLARLGDSATCGEGKGPSEEACSAGVAEQELRPYAPVDDVLILAAADRAALHEREETVLTSVLTNHLGFEAVPETNKHLWPRLEELRRAGLLTVAERRGEPFWGLTAVGRERLEAEREAGRVGELPEAPQHRAWRHTRVEAAVRIEGFRGDLIAAVQDAGELIDRYRPVISREWLELSGRLRWASWRLASAHLLPDRVARARRRHARPRREPGTTSGAAHDLSLEPKHRERGGAMTKTEAKAIPKRNGKPPEARSKDGRLGPGQLDELAYMREHKGAAPHTASAIGKVDHPEPLLSSVTLQDAEAT